MLPVIATTLPSANDESKTPKLEDRCKSKQAIKRRTEIAFNASLTKKMTLKLLLYANSYNCYYVMKAMTQSDPNWRKLTESVISCLI